MSNLIIEDRIRQASSEMPMSCFRFRVSKTGNFLMLMQLTRALLVLLLGNSGVKRDFSYLSDIVHKKRQRWDGTSPPSKRWLFLVHRRQRTVASRPILTDCEFGCNEAKITAKKEENERRRFWEEELQSKIEEERKKNKKIQKELSLKKD